ncbi:MAG: NADH/ubiquinone/plastoquinone (complex I) [Verrucomicrobia bacterium]|nr:NADH/ubiquinone/plastoquinone (complex I) [Verrucomicrobiota bacterium]
MIPLFVAIPLGMAFIIPMVSRKLTRAPDVLGNATMVCLTALALASIGRTGIYHMGGWETPIGIDLRLDGLSVLLLIAVNVVGLAATLFSVDYMRLYTSKFRYYSLFLFMVAGMNGVVLTGDMFNLFVFMEIASISSYALVAFGCEHEELEAAFKYTVLGSVASTFVLLAIAFMYGMTGTLNMAHVATKIASEGMSTPLMFALSLFLCGFGLKAALVPFHAWLPDAHPAAPAPISAMLSGVLIKAIGVYVLARLLFNVFGITDNLLQLLRWAGVLSMVVGGLLAIGQWDIKRLFAYSSISQVGYIVLGLGLGTPLGLVGGLYHLVNHSIFKSLLFLNAGAVEYATGERDMRKLGGLNKVMPLTGGTSLVGSMAIAGIPPFNGFWSKLIIVLACVQSGHYALAVTAVVMSLVTLSFQLKVQRYVFFGSVRAGLDRLQQIPGLMAAPMLILAVLCVGMAFLIITGMDTPLLIAPAADALAGGFFTL